MKSNNYCIIMAGGSNSLLWPLCRESRPKQFVDIHCSGKSMLREAYERCLSLVPDENIIVVSLSKYKNQVLGDIPELPEQNLLLEPYGRKTGPCIAYATYSLLKRNPDAVCAFIPSDLRIEDNGKYRETIEAAFAHVDQNDVLLTIGVTPDRPDPNYGYIQVVGGKDAGKEGKPVKVKTFTEKPDVTLAEIFCKSGEFYWNSGIFVWKSSVIRHEMEKYMPEVTETFSGWEGAIGSGAESDFVNKAYTNCAKVSIDNGVMEKTDIAWLIPAGFGWADIDNWSAYYDHCETTDAHRNVIPDGQTGLVEKTEGCLVVNTGKKKKLVAIKGLKDYVIVDTDDVLLICPKNDEDYRSLVDKTALPGFEDFK